MSSDSLSTVVYTGYSTIVGVSELSLSYDRGLVLTEVSYTREHR